MKQFRIKEERYNKAKKEFETEFAKLKEAERAYNSAWWKEGEIYGITPELFNKLTNFLNNISDEIPTREYINLPTSSEEQSRTMLDLTTSNNQNRILNRIISIINNILYRINGKSNKTEAVTNEDSESTIKDYEGKSEQSLDDRDDKENEGIEIEYAEDLDDEKEYNVEELIEICRKALQELKEKSEDLDREYEKYINDAPSGKIIEKIHDGPGILDDYRQGSWGIERICLDGFQNHLSADARGTKCYLHFLINSGWVDRDTALKHRDEIKEVRFSDNGVGFTPDNLFYLHSTKTSEDISAGQFGEGMKLASIAAVNLGLELEFQSRNWRAKVIGEEKRITNTRKNDEVENRKQLIYDVEIYDGEPIVRL